MGFEAIFMGFSIQLSQQTEIKNSTTRAKGVYGGDRIAKACFRPPGVP
jgi:hypothetical protein